MTHYFIFTRVAQTTSDMTYHQPGPQPI